MWMYAQVAATCHTFNDVLRGKQEGLRINVQLILRRLLMHSKSPSSQTIGVTGWTVGRGGGVPCCGYHCRRSYANLSSWYFDAMAQQWRPMRMRHPRVLAYSVARLTRYLCRENGREIVL